MRSGRSAERLPPGGGRLARMVDWAQALLAEALAPGDLAIDLTAGNGGDTLFLFRTVGGAGRVLAFDIQPSALAEAARRLTAAGAAVDCWDAPPSGPIPPGVHLVRAGHQEISRFLRERPQAVVANLGYLPGGDPTLITETAATLSAVEQSLHLLAPGGRMAITAYPGHPGGAAEASAVTALFSSLSPREWQVLRLESLNRHRSPFLLLAARHP